MDEEQSLSALAFLRRKMAVPERHEASLKALLARDLLLPAAVRAVGPVGSVGAMGAVGAM